MTDSRPLPLDIGIVAAGRLSGRQLRLLQQARAEFARLLSQWLPRFQCNVHLVRRRDIGEFRREESSVLLLEAADERELHHWDFVLLVTADELIAHYRPFALAALSRPLDAAVLSLSRLLEASTESEFGVEPDADSDTVRIAIDRLTTLMLHAFGHLGGLSPAEEEGALLYRPGDAVDLDRMSRFDASELAELEDVLEDVADARLEEITHGGMQRGEFVRRAAWINRGEILDAVLAARPWLFPVHLSRLTTAAVSTIALLLMTAEAWDLGLAQPVGRLSALALFGLLFTTVFVARKQHLLVRRRGHGSEQQVVTRLSALLIVVTGLATTWLGICGLALLAESVFFGSDLVVAWAGASALDSTGGLTLGVLLRMAAFVSSIALLIGALGASFEEQHHFQHVIYVDAEI